MKKITTNIPLLLLLAVSIFVVSVYADLGKHSWCWCQRSGSLIVLIGAVMGYRSVFRRGFKGVGGENTQFMVGTLKSYDNNENTMKVGLSEKDRDALAQDFWDKAAGYIGIILMIYGTLLWGYGDLLGRVFN